MAWEYAELFDIVNPKIMDMGMMADFWKDEQTAIRVGSMGYRTRTTKAGTRLEADIYPMFGREKMGRLRAARKSMTPEKQRKANISRAKHRLILLMETNFNAWEDITITLSYAGEEPRYERCQKDIKRFFEKVRRLRKKMNLDPLKYIYAIGHDEQQRIHAHVVMSGGIDRGQLERTWGHGTANSYQLQEYGNGIQGMANYLYKQYEKAKIRGERFSMKSWTPSRNLKKPKVRTSDSKVSNRRVKIIAQDFRNQAKDVMEKVYPGYTLEECHVFYSDIVDGVYIRCVMRRKEGICSNSGGKRNTGSTQPVSSDSTRKTQQPTLDDRFCS